VDAPRLAGQLDADPTRRAADERADPARIVSWFPAAYVAWLALVALQRLYELQLTRTRLRALSESERAQTGDAPWTWRAMVALHAGLIVLPACEVFLLDRRPPIWMFAVAVVVFAGAQALRYWAIASAGRAWNARAVVAPSMTVSEHGPYRFVRHPNYLAVLIEFTAVPLGGGAWISWILLNALHAPVLAARIRGEERLLGRLPEWRASMAHKGRFWPRRTTA
jgi:methyltransferase